MWPPPPPHSPLILATHTHTPQVRYDDGDKEELLLAAERVQMPACINVDDLDLPQPQLLHQVRYNQCVWGGCLERLVQQAYGA